MAETITSSSNPAIKLARALNSRRRIRSRERAFTVDGTRLLPALIDGGLRLRILFVDSDRQHQIDPGLLDRVAAVAERVLLLNKQLFKTISVTEQPQPLAAIFEMADVGFPASSTFVLALDAIRDPGNLGTIIRTANAAGIDGIALLPGTADPYNPKSVRASAGAIATLPVRSFTSVGDITAVAFKPPPQIALADSSGCTEYDQVDWTRPSLLILGNEARGASRDTQQSVDIVVRIPINSTVESLNAAMASAVVMFEAQRQRRRSFD